MNTDSDEKLIARLAPFALYVLMLDGAYPFTGGDPHFHRDRVPTDDALARLLDALIRRILHTLTRRDRVVYLPTTLGYSLLLLSVEDPRRFVERLARAGS